MNRTVVFLLPLLFASLVLSGCGEPHPDGMPKLYPASITLTEDGAPLSNVLILFISEDEELSKWGPGGVTDDSGVAEIRTDGKYKGVPLGTYKVLVSKNVPEPHPHPEWANLPETDPNYRKYTEIANSLGIRSHVNRIYGSLDTTPLTIDITKDQKSYSISIEKKPSSN